MIDLSGRKFEEKIWKSEKLISLGLCLLAGSSGKGSSRGLFGLTKERWGRKMST